MRVKIPTGHFRTDHDHAIYTASELDFLRALDSWKRGKQRPRPTWADVLDILRGLGYRRDGFDFGEAAELREFERAIDQYRRRHRRPFPSCREVLAVAVAIGYRQGGGADQADDLVVAVNFSAT